MRVLRGAIVLVAVIVIGLALAGCGSSGDDENKNSKADTGSEANAPDYVDAGWRFAYNEGSVIAYSYEGEVRTLWESDDLDPNETPVACYQFGSKTAVFQSHDLDEALLLSPDGVQPLTPDGFMDNRWSVVAYHAPYAVFSVPLEDSEALGPPDLSALVVNLQTGALMPLSGVCGDVIWTNPLRFSEDGRTLRYLSEIDRDTTLYELDLQTGEEREVFSGLRLLWHGPDHFGEHWVYGAWDPETNRSAYSLVAISGEVDPVDQIPEGERWLATLTQEHLVLVQSTCDPDCAVEAWPLEGGDPMSFVIPGIDDHILIGNTALYDNAHLLVEVTYPTYQIWYAHRDEAAELLYDDPSEGAQDGMDRCGPIRPVISPDGRWAVISDRYVTAGDPQRFGLWDSTVQDFVLVDSASCEVQAGSAYFLGDPAETVAIYPDHFFSAATIFHAADSTVLRLPGQSDEVQAPGDWRYPPVSVPLPDGTVIYNQHQDGDLSAGLYKYDPAAETHDLLVEGAWWPCWHIPFDFTQ